MNCQKPEWKCSIGGGYQPIVVCQDVVHFAYSLVPEYVTHEYSDLNVPINMNIYIYMNY